jgi:drug/metabolite transporter (DMT)-like permease
VKAVQKGEIVGAGPVGLSATLAARAVLVMLLWAACFPLINIGLADSPPMFFATLRAGVAGVVLLVAAQWLRRPAIKGRAVWVGIVVVALTATSLGFFGMFYGGARVSPGLATVITNTQPLMAAVLAWWLLGEQLSALQRWGLVVGFAGIVLIGVPGLSDSDSELLGILFILIGAAGIAVSNVVLKRIAHRVDILRAMGWQLLIGALPLATLALATEDPNAIDWTWTFILNLVILSVLGTSAVFALWFALLRRASLSQLNVFTFLTPIFGLIIGVLWFTEKLSGLTLAGITLSLVGIYLVSRISGDAKANETRTNLETEHRG